MTQQLQREVEAGVRVKDNVQGVGYGVLWGARSDYVFALILMMESSRDHL